MLKTILKLLFMSIFFSYYVIAIIINFPWINTHFKPLKIVHLDKLIKIDNYTYLGTYPNTDDIKKYKKSLGIQNIIVLLNPHSIFYRGLIKEEEKICSKLDIKYIIIPVSTNPMDYILVKDILHELKGVTLIHRYYFDEEMHILQNILTNY